ncbi:MAG: hypothetical protein JZU47_04290 [Prolixibacteraceae bacterium]|nr:hypothetical protein [Prolixibacteraceae bacterium]
MEQQNLSISNFKKFFKRILIPFAILIVSIGSIINYYFEKKIVLGSPNAGVYKVNRIINENNIDEICFFGSSRAEGTFIPDSLVKNGFNYGIFAAQDDVVLFFLKEECKKKDKKNAIVINFDLDGLNYSLGDISNYIYNSEYPAVKELISINYKNVFRVPFVKYAGYYEMYTKYYINDKFNLTRYTNKGASIEKIETSKEYFKELVDRQINAKRVFRNDPKLSIELSKIIKSNPHRKFIFVIAPYHKSFFDGFTNFQDAELYLASLKKNSNVTVLDFGKIDFPNEYFFDTRHLNLKGAIGFNRILKDSLNVILAK